MSGIRYIRRAVGLPDFAACGVRYKTIAKSILREGIDSKTPFRRRTVKIRRPTYTHRTPHGMGGTWADSVLLFPCVARTREVRNLRECDIILGEVGIGESATIYFVTDRGRWNLPRLSLTETHDDIFPVRPFARRVSSKERNPIGACLLFNPAISDTAEKSAKWEAEARGLPTSMSGRVPKSHIRMANIPTRIWCGYIGYQQSLEVGR